MTFLNVGTYPPKQCGIATFSMDFRNSLLFNGHQVAALAVSDDAYDYQYPPEVLFNIKQSQLSDYVQAANFINNHRDIHMVIIQHEYGIYGGLDGDYILDLVQRLHKPYILICHTVLPHPSKHQKQVLDMLCYYASSIVAMTKHSAQLLINLYEAPAELISVIAHGVPSFKKQEGRLLKRKHHLSGQDIISTFGLIGPGKGLELGIQAFGLIAQEFPNARYLILGQTHPMLVKNEGEKYRNMLENLVKKLDLDEQVLFVNKYLTDEELGEYLYLTDVYLSPYPNRDQAVSGTMAFALGCGRAIVSTPYAYAREMLSNGRGLLSESIEPEELAVLLARVLSDRTLKLRLQDRAWQLGKSWTWSNIGKQYSRLAYNILQPETISREGGSSFSHVR
ncbi:MAG: glycosyltransferase family 4 protein [Syntrophomonadaceae bacterium]|jgi:glycosyltransferase involved in cell wall biosynthesis